MPQNFRTRSVSLHQALYEELLKTPAYPAPRGGRLFHCEYRVVDLVLADGRCLDSVLAIGDDFLVHEDTPVFESEDVVSLAATPPERHADFTVTDAESLRRACSIEQGNAERLFMFGPEVTNEKTDWRLAPLEDAWEEAEEIDARVYTWDGELPATIHSPRLIRLEKEGFRICYLTASTEESAETVIRPQGTDLWGDLLDRYLEVAPDFCLGDLISLLDLPEAVSRYVFAATMPGYYGSDTFERWVRAVRENPPADEPAETGDVPIEFLQVSVDAERRSNETFDLSWDISAMSVVLEADDHDGYVPAGDRIPYSSSSMHASGLAATPFRIDEELVIPVTIEERCAFLRGPRRAWDRAGRREPEPEMPVALRLRKRITLRDFIGAVLPEISRRSAADE